MIVIRSTLTTGIADLEEEDEGPTLDSVSNVFMDHEDGKWVRGLRTKLDLLQDHLHMAYR